MMLKECDMMACLDVIPSKKQDGIDSLLGITITRCPRVVGDEDEERSMIWIVSLILQTIRGEIIMVVLMGGSLLVVALLMLTPLRRLMLLHLTQTSLFLLMVKRKSAWTRCGFCIIKSGQVYVNIRDGDSHRTSWCCEN